MIMRDSGGRPVRVGEPAFDAACVLIAALHHKFERFVRWERDSSEAPSFDWPGLLSDAYASGERTHLRLAFDFWSGNWNETNLMTFGVPSLSDAICGLSKLEPLQEAIDIYRPGRWPGSFARMAARSA
jgi:hypothetical protein